MEYNLIRNLTIKDLLVLTTHIRNEDISDTPFKFNEKTVCPQPFQLSELYMDDCTELKTFDYTTQSKWEMAATWSTMFLFVEVVIMFRMFTAACIKHRRAQVLASGLIRCCKNVGGSSLVDREGKVMLFWEECNGSKENFRQVVVKCGPGKHIKLYFSDSGVRDVNLFHQTQLRVLRPIDDPLRVVVKIPHEYDIVLRCHNALDRTTFMDKLQSFLTDIGVGHTIEEFQKKIMLRMVYTKQDRQRLLENFFKSVFHRGAVTETCSDAFEFELTREEFADTVSLRKDCLYVEKMFQLIDRGGENLLPLRKFVDMIVLFVKGSLEKKMKFLFDTYDIHKSGELYVNNVKLLLKALVEAVQVSVLPDPSLCQRINQIIESNGFQNKQSYTPDEICELLRASDVELHPVHLTLAGLDDTGIEVEESNTVEAATSNLCSIAPHTIYNGMAEDLEQRASINVPVQRRVLVKSALGRMVATFFSLMENYKLHIFHLVLFELTVAAIFVERAYYYSVEREDAGFRRITGHVMAVARGSSSVLMFTYSVLLLTMSRNFITYLRETIFNYYIPFDSYITFHKIVALQALFISFVHLIGHGINFHLISTQRPDDLACIFREVYYPTHILPNFSYWLFLTMSGYTGLIVTLIITIIAVFSIPYVRRHAFRAFWYTHRLYVPFYILLFLHGSGRLVQDPLFGNFFLGPGIIYALDLLVSVSRRKHEVAVVRADILPSQVIRLLIKRPTLFDYKAGQWLRVASRTHNPSEFHSFTITSAPHEEYLSLHIRAVGAWTLNLVDHCNRANLCSHAFPKLYIDGPFGEGHQDWFRYEVAILVGGGIGVTPFASILKELVHRFNIGARVECRKVNIVML